MDTRVLAPWSAPGSPGQRGAELGPPPTRPPEAAATFRSLSRHHCSLLLITEGTYAGTTRVEPPWPGALPAASRSTGHVPVSCRGRCSPTAGVPGPRLAWGLFSRADSLTPSLLRRVKASPRVPGKVDAAEVRGTKPLPSQPIKKKKFLAPLPRHLAPEELT